jgi:hypothetical protein
MPTTSAAGAHYYAQDPDRMATRFETFLKLAPDAPERPEVLRIMKAAKGRQNA